MTGPVKQQIRLGQIHQHPESPWSVWVNCAERPYGIILARVAEEAFMLFNDTVTALDSRVWASVAQTLAAGLDQELVL